MLARAKALAFDLGCLSQQHIQFRSLTLEVACALSKSREGVNGEPCDT